MLLDKVMSYKYRLILNLYLLVAVLDNPV